MRTIGCGLTALAVSLTACAQDLPGASVISSSESVGVGDGRRVMFSVVDAADGEYLASPDRTATVTLADENGSPLDTYPTEFLWVEEGERGVYVAYLDVRAAETYRATLEVGGLGQTRPTGLLVVDDPQVLQPGDPAQPSVTRTADEARELESVTSDPTPDPRFYQSSIDAALTSGVPTVVVFGSPRWCISPTCASLLDQVKGLAHGYPGIEFIHVETYEDTDVENRDDLVTVPAVADWGLPSEPWVFVIDDTGEIVATFEGVASDAELSHAFDRVAG